jgi:aspartyl/asparaginyl-tRNA synthetase
MNKLVFNQEVIGPQDFNNLINQMRTFFMQKNYKEVYPQPIRSIMAACEDPKTLRSFTFDGNTWPLSQTNQMNLEMILLTMPEEADGIYCMTTSYRDEPNPIPNRHDKIFPMWEFEHKGDYQYLMQTLSELAVHLGFVKSVKDIPIFTYNELCNHYGVTKLEAEHETLMWKEYGDVVGISYFTSASDPFWNMKESGTFDEKTGDKLFNKIDFIICGIETFGAAERSTNVEQMRNNFHSVSGGMYAKLLYNEFGKDRVENELEEYLSLPMFKRVGAGIGFTRLYRAMKLKELI